MHIFSFSRYFQVGFPCDSTNLHFYKYGLRICAFFTLTNNWYQYTLFFNVMGMKYYIIIVLILSSLTDKAEYFSLIYFSSSPNCYCLFRSSIQFSKLVGLLFVILYQCKIFWISILYQLKYISNNDDFYIPFTPYLFFIENNQKVESRTSGKDGGIGRHTVPPRTNKRRTTTI